MNGTSMEVVITDLDVEVYPITLVKFLLNKNKIFNFFNESIKKEVLEKKFPLDNKDCSYCQKTNFDKCRKHESVNRIINISKDSKVLYIKELDCYFFRNEIFKVYKNRLGIIYCPHTKIIKKPITKSKVFEVISFIIEDEKINIPNFENIISISLEDSFFMRNYYCWFDDQFYIFITPQKNKQYEFFLHPNL